MPKKKTTTKKATSKKKTTTKKKTKKKMGRPKVEFKDEYCDKLIEHMSEGMSFESFAGVIGVGRETLYKWVGKEDPKTSEDKARHPEFKDARKIAIEQCLLYWENEGKKGMWGGKNFNPSVWIFNMRNRFGWRDEPQKGAVDQEDKNITINLAYDPDK